MSKPGPHKQHPEEKQGFDVDQIKSIVADKAQKVGAEAKKYGKKGGAKLAQSVEKNPLKAVGIAAVAGAVLGLFFRRKKK